MELEWDEAKRRANLVKHDVDIVYAALIFEGWVYQAEDRRYDYGEVRFRSVGMLDGQCYVVVHTERNGCIRLISAWKGGRRDREKYQARYAGRDSPDAGTR